MKRCNERDCIVADAEVEFHRPGCYIAPACSICCTDITGNTHARKFCITSSTRPSLLLVGSACWSCRGFEMAPHAQMS